MNFTFFPYTSNVQVKIANITDEPVSKNPLSQKLKEQYIENGLFSLLSKASRKQPKLAKNVSKLSAAGIPLSEKVDYSHKVFVTTRNVKFCEMEYCVPASNTKKITLEIQERIIKEQFAVHFPIEYRFVKGDDAWLSPSYKRDSLYVAVHMYKGMDFDHYFHVMNEIFEKYEGRPHWGKQSYLPVEKYPSLYRELNNFKKIRMHFDPHNLFVNDYLSFFLK
ncbi:D-arabinono-1,4-lactone oxidase [Bacillus carboniphilus]|uniref:D-arabinono-1,4-lactone oxidase n=1 Tax=Bacillus carboniphilus TaxID=86663 RepID=A0ABY9JPM6_9BACI|nr:D-arabinono-1,4-lactone oxidase [Bacillus carboniphilus]WLR41364.1 D-arabinono-1,4-lactone oxidase [Bacillus carboniphilus]